MEEYAPLENIDDKTNEEYAQLENINDKTLYPICLENGILTLRSIHSDDANVDILLPYKDIDLVHCQLKITNQQVELHDLSIAKSVKVNGRCLMRPIYLRSFDEVIIGSQKLKFCYKEDYEVSHNNNINNDVEELSSKKDYPENQKVSVKAECPIFSTEESDNYCVPTDESDDEADTEPDTEGSNYSRLNFQ